MTPNPTASDCEASLAGCPFCGGEAFVRCEGRPERCYVACTNLTCFCAVGEGYDRDAMSDHMFETDADAIAAWNTRITPRATGEAQRCGEVSLGLTQRVEQMDAATGLAKECLERATYLHSMEPEGLSTIERQAMETLYKAAAALTPLSDRGEG